MAILILAVVIGSLAALHEFGILERVPLSWDLVCRMFLYILLLLGVLAVVLKSWSIIVILAHLPRQWLVSPSGNPALDVISTALLALALYGIWRWRKWGAYLVLIRLALTIAIQVFIYRSGSWHLFHGYTGRDNVLADVSGAMMWIVGFSLTWRHFE